MTLFTESPHIPQRVRDITGRRLGPATVMTFHTGQGSQVTATLCTGGAHVFLKAVDVRGRAADLRRIELRVQPFLPAAAPRLLWHVDDGDWLVMCFEHAPGRHADLSPGSPDLPVIAAALDNLAGQSRPDLPVLPVVKRWAPFCPPSSLDALQGDTLVHTDLSPGNILIGDTVRIVDWAWPTVGAAWLDTALMIPRLIEAGHTPAQAEQWASTVPAWATAKPAAVAACIRARVVFARQRDAAALQRSVQQWQAHRAAVQPAT